MAGEPDLPYKVVYRTLLDMYSERLEKKLDRKVAFVVIHGYGRGPRQEDPEHVYGMNIKRAIAGVLQTYLLASQPHIQKVYVIFTGARGTTPVLGNVSEAEVLYDAYRRFMNLIFDNATKNKVEPILETEAKRSIENISQATEILEKKESLDNILFAASVTDALHLPRSIAYVVQALAKQYGVETFEGAPFIQGTAYPTFYHPDHALSVLPNKPPVIVGEAGAYYKAAQLAIQLLTKYKDKALKALEKLAQNEKLIEELAK